MTLNPDWKRILFRAWSVRFIFFAGLLSGLEVILPYLGDAFPIPTGAFALLSVVITTAAFVARIVTQKDFKDGE